MSIEEAKQKLFQRITEFYGDNLLSVVFYGAHLKGKLNEIDVLVIIDKPYDPVKLNRVADFIENIKEPVEREYGYFIAFELYTREEAENFHASYLDIAKAYEVAYDKGDYFKNLLRRMTHPDTSMEHIKYLTTIEILKDE
ncbi:nucleotidyltransferase [Thermococcus sp. M39]|uniref:nucleotidyltransferase n=1 Tax=unclassified Thermococcus TaxID=2627626 RepID=UPI00143B471F|nr:MULTISPECIES: nucleotidyltransferase [unclassified Thermococcus]NJE07107.1 nucleotidyltransferase [Thermococcus sp. M39]NJE13717.1 nucleotidyltransferase [Thermococcus sp. LS2]